jgi:hypothetical protein
MGTEGTGVNARRSNVLTLVVAIFLIVFIGVGVWLTFARDLMSRADVERYILINSPYAQERASLRESIVRHEAIIERNSESVVTMRQQMSIIMAKLDIIIQNLEDSDK